MTIINLCISANLVKEIEFLPYGLNVNGKNNKPLLYTM
jgi:hypothetical protein